MADAEYCFASFCLASGSWANWISGLMSAAAVTVALSGYFIADCYRRRDARDADIATAQIIGLKTWKTLNSSEDVRSHLWNDGGVDADAWRRIQPLVGIQVDEGLRLTASEMGLLVRMEEMEFLRQLLLAVTRLESVVLSLKDYQQRHEEVQRMLPVPVTTNGTVAHHCLTLEQSMALKPYTNALEQLLRSLREQSRENVVTCNQLARDFHPMMKARFKDARFVKIEPTTTVE